MTHWNDRQLESGKLCDVVRMRASRIDDAPALRRTPAGLDAGDSTRFYREALDRRIDGESNSKFTALISIGAGDGVREAGG